jgi:hypothetical protein
VTTQTDRIRALNDELRQHMQGGLAVITPGVAALGQDAVELIVKTIAVFDDFCHANDPHEEHDFGSQLHRLRRHLETRWNRTQLVGALFAKLVEVDASNEELQVSAIPSVGCAIFAPIRQRQTATT